MYISIIEFIGVLLLVYVLMLLVAFIQKKLYDKYWYMDSDKTFRNHFTWRRFFKDIFQ